MKKIVFLEPPYGKFIERLDAPFSLMYLGAVAEQCGWEAEIVDMQKLDDPIPSADVYAVTSSSPQFPTAVKLEARLADEFPDSLRILGGNHISAEIDSIFQTSFNIAVAGEGEVVLSGILSHPEQYKTSTCVKIQGVPIANLDIIPFPARHLIDWTKYNRGICWGTKMLAPAVSIVSSRGCPNRCVYCGSHVVFGRYTRFRSIENVVAEVKHVIDTMGYHGFNFHDDTFCLDPKRVMKLSKEFEKLDIVWRCLTRVDTISEELLEAMQKGGCRELVAGIESGSQRVLDRIQKGVTVEQNLRAMKLIKKSGIQLKAGIMVGSPGETKETVEETKKLLRECPPDTWAVSVFTPFPGSAVWNNPAKYGVKILTRDLDQYAMVSDNYKGTVVAETEDMTKEDIEQARDELIDLLLDISGPTYSLKKSEAST